MEFKKLDKTYESEITFKDTLSVLEGNRTRVRTLCNMILTSCSIFLSTSFVLLIFLIKESYKDSLIILKTLILTDVTLIFSIFFCLASVYIREPKSITTQFDLISQQAYYYRKEQKNARIAIVFLFIGIITLIIGLFLFGIKIIR